MRKFLGYLLIGIISLFILAGISLLIFLQQQKPTLDGQLVLENLSEEVVVKFDNYGVPHIYANNAHDAYLALGYVHAQDRLFQMEMLRRVANGKLAEILGPDQLYVDKLFRTLGIGEFAKQRAKEFEAEAFPECKEAVHAYLDGINTFVRDGATPIEFSIIGISKTEFGVEDVYSAAGFMAFGFAEGLRADPIMQKIHDQFGDAYLLPFLGMPDEASRSRNHFPTETNEKLIASINTALDAIPVPLWHGSNGWAVSAKKSKSGMPILANDTHIGFGQPAVWYEAHLEYPGFSFYGHHIAGIPFGILGNNRKVFWGFTMFENDDVDFFIEEKNPENENQVRFKDSWEDLRIREEVIKVKGADDVILQVKLTRHGPLMNGINKDIPEDGSPVALSWTLTREKNPLLEVMYNVNRAASLNDITENISKLPAPGLNMLYADVDGNIAWFAIAKLPVRKDGHTNSKLFQNGASGEDEYEGFYPFSKNPRSVNPPWGYVCSSNNQPDSVDGVFYPGYYYPRARIQRIDDYLNTDRTWSASEMQEINLDVVSLSAPDVAKEIAEVLRTSNDPAFEQIINTLSGWDGDHKLADTAPVVYYTMLSTILFDAMEDELGFEALNSLCNTSIMKSNYLALIQDKNSPWWDNVLTDKTESRRDIIAASASKALAILTKEYGSDASAWEWHKAHTLTHNHPLGAVKLLSSIFNVGPFEVPGGIEVVNNLMFPLDSTAHFKVISGPALRKVTDLGDLERGQTVSPTGQSGNMMSDHYDDQARMFATGQTRTMLMNKDEIEKNSSHQLTLIPKK